ncbi:OLC1v1000692C1 [Oldenlandia corymbosa var. corymbosa]|uniref:OLC1v1000692C1 n=1 Tax=Oldenlandia corymbosa var. corymbosa TaxID=529605 RepID=A0AAV1D512_OLDCO|nr:OLC1v1000692C1 [Oldenlandia corymbosa var. corymbosa]
MAKKGQLLASSLENENCKHPVIPTINFTKENLNPGTQNWVSTCNSVRKAMEEFGVFVAVYEDGDGILGSDLINSVFTSVEEFFNLPKETKQLYTDVMPGSGYFGEKPNSLIEAIGIGDSTRYEPVQSLTKLMWPDGNDAFCETILNYTREASKLGEIVTRMIFESYGVEKYCDSYINSTSYLLRANSYKTAKANETNNVGIIPHTDTSFVSIVKENGVSGLGVKYSKDGTWIPITFPPSSFAIMAGDALLAWSNGRIQPCFHRVIMGKKARRSLGLFCFHKGIVQVLEELSDHTNEPLQFNSFDHFGLLKFRLRNPTLSSEERVKAFCGVKNI